MNSNFFYFLLFILLTIIFAIIIGICFFDKANKSKYYNYKIMYDSEYEKYDKMKKKQKMVFFKKKIYLKILLFMVSVKDLIKWN